MRMASLPALAALALVVTSAAAPARAQDAADIAQKMQATQRALEHWQIDEAVKLAGELNAALPDVPPVQALVGAVKFHQGDYEGAVRLLERAAEGGEVPPLLELARSTREETKGYVSFESEHFVLRVPPGKDEVLAETALWSLEKAFEHVSKAFDYKPDHKIPVDVLHDPAGLASVSTLTVDEIKTSGTIALCKYNRLMITSPKALARGYGWLDTLAHELIHLVISEKSHNNVPIWLHEGLAKYSESLWRDGTPGLALDPASENLLAEAVKKKELITFEQMHPSMAKLPSQKDTALAFAEVFTVIEYLHTDASRGAPGYASTNALLEKLRMGLDMDAALKASVGRDLAALQKSWQRYLRKRKFRITPGAKRRQLKFVDGRRQSRDDGEEEAEAALSEAESRKGRRYVRLGNLLRQRGRVRAATVEYERALTHVGSRSPALHNRLAGLYLELDDAPKAKGVLETNLKAFPDDPQTHVLLGRTALRAEAWDDAKRHYLRATWENPFNPEIHVGLYRVGEKTGDDELMKKSEANVRLLSGHAKKNARADAPGNIGDGEPFGTLSLQTQPWGQVWVDGYATGITTPLEDYRLAPGKHRVRVEDRAAGLMESKELLVVEGEASRLSWKLRRMNAAEREALLAAEAREEDKPPPPELVPQ
jgi:tetratricopeptide (TPR) repeat protein